MQLFELNKIIEGNYKEECKIPYQEISGTKEAIKDFQLIMHMDSGFQSRFALTESANEFFIACPDFKNLLGKDVLEEVFYATKLGFYFDGVPSRLTYILQKSVSSRKLPNAAIESIPSSEFGRFLKRGSLGEGLTIKRVLDSLLGWESKLLSEFMPVVQSGSVFEAYVPNVNRVIILPKDLATGSLEDFKTLEFVKGVGVCMHGKPLRFFGGRVGITRDEFDLRECL